MKKKLIVEIEFIEQEETKTKPVVYHNLVVFPLKGGYEFYYSDDEQELNKLSLKKVRVIEVEMLDDVTQLLLEKNKELSREEKNFLRHKN